MTWFTEKVYFYSSLSLPTSFLQEVVLEFCKTYSGIYTLSKFETNPSHHRIKLENPVFFAQLHLKG